MKKYPVMVLMITVLCVFSSYSQVVVPHVFSLSQNVPDPFDTSGTNIEFTLPKTASVSLWVEDINGNQVDTLMSRFAVAGNYQIHFIPRSIDGGYLVPGIYLCKMKVDSQNITIFRDSIQMHLQMVTGVRENASGVQPSCFRLNQNYPNPFNPMTTISFNLPSRSFVSLKVFDLLGREVAIIVSEELLAGSYFKQWNATNVSSGIYFYRLQAETSIETKKLILLK
jgi:hypothetical protein